MSQKFLDSLNKARARTIASPLAGTAAKAVKVYPVFNAAGKQILVSVPPREDEGTVTEPRIMWGCIREGRTSVDIMTLTSSRESAQAGMDNRNRLDYQAIRKGTLQPYVRVLCVEIKEIPS